MWEIPKILIVEDEPELYECIGMMIKRMGYEVLPPAVNGIEAIDITKSYNPDIILMDIGLEGNMDGIETAKHIKEISDVPVIYVSAHDDKGFFRRAKSSGPYSYLIKPINRRELQANIEMSLYKHKIGRDIKVNRAMAELSKMLIHTDPVSIDELAEQILQYAKQLTESTYGYVGFIDPDTGFLIIPTLTRDVWSMCNVTNKSIVFEKLGGLIGWVLDNKMSLLTNEPEKDPRKGRTPEGHIVITRLLSVPVLIGNKLIGQISVANSTHDYTESDLNVLERLADYYALALERKRVGDELKKYSQTLEQKVRMRTKELQSSNRLLEEEIITRKAAEQYLEKESQFSNLIIENMADGLSVCHAVDQYPFVRFTVWNNRMTEITGYKMEEINRLGWYQSMYPDRHIQTRAIQRMERMRKGDNIVAEEWEITRKDGAKRILSISTSILDSEDKSVHVLGLMQDITERKKAEGKLRRFSYVIEQSPVVVTITDTEGRIEYVNRMFIQVTGYSLDEVAGKTHRILKSGKTPPDVYESLWSNLIAGQQWQGEFCNRLKNGKEIYERATVFPLRDTDGKVTNYLKISRDITEQKRLEAELRQSQKMEAIGQLAGGIAHDFNNILSAIKNYAFLLRKRLKDDELLLSFVNHIFSSTDKAANLTQGLLAFSRKQVINPKPINLTLVIADLEKLLKRLIREDIELRVILHHAGITVNADNVQIEMALMNLVTNAMDAMLKGGTLLIEADIIQIDKDFIDRHNYGIAGPYARITVSDNGVGMDESTRERIFEPFFTTKELGKGTGLGLATVYGIVKQHDGYIYVYSELDSGTTFTILLPLVNTAIEQLPNVELTKARGGSEIILLAEDDTEMRIGTKVVLEEAGYKVIEAADGIDAIKKFEESITEIDLVLLDVVMPKANGKVVYNHIKNTGSSAKIIFVSGYPYEMINNKGILEQLGTYLQKPVRPDDLLNKIREVLDE